MEPEKREYFKSILNEEMRALLGEAGKTVTEMNIDASNFPDPTDRATQESDRNFELRIRDRERKLINKIKDALDRIEADEFGICEDCGEEISEARLKVRPVTTQCINCKMDAEKKERH
ncbi:MAG: RNA polymerase-binding protein DksA [Steroidobacteraceae bacterium]|nr:RNA polymerase-binding protein DksA [Deltaproteobacteria bacterium]